MHCEVERVADPARLEHLTHELERRLQDVVRVTDDFAAMLGALESVLAEVRGRFHENGQQEAETAEIRAFLEWLRDGAFVFLGYRAYDLLAGEQGREGVAVVPATASGMKCERCWRVLPEVGAHADHPGLCDRCHDAVTSGVLARRAAA